MVCTRVGCKTVFIQAVSLSLVLQCLSLARLSYAGSPCLRQISQVEKGRKCRKSCQVDSDCRGKQKSCLCDDVCGLSCYNPSSQCRKLQPPQNGRMSFSGHTVGKTVKYICKKGHTLLGPKVRTCRSDRKWSGEDPTCEDLSKCGVGGNLNIQRVVGGTDAIKGSWPWQVVLLRKNNILRKSDIFAGGSIINNNWILTAAHVFLEFPGILTDIDWKTKFTMIAGVTYFPDENDKLPDEAIFIEPNRVILHEDFNPRANNFDIALIEVGTTSKGLPTKKSGYVNRFGSIPFSTYIRPICLPCNLRKNIQVTFNDCLELQKNHTSNAMVTGFGTANVMTIEYPKYLQEGKLTIMPQSSCYDVLRGLSSHASKIPSGLVCAKGRSPGTDACYGDSGGPLVQQVKINEFEVRWVQTGIVSFGFDCGGKYPGYYTATSQFITWISKHIQTQKPTDQKRPISNNTQPSKLPSGQEGCNRIVSFGKDRAAPWRVTMLLNIFRDKPKLTEDGYTPAAYGIIINQRWILSVAHPFPARPCSQCVVARFGEDDNSRLYWISGIIFHPKLDRKTLQYNAVLVKVGSSFRLNSRGWIYDRSVPSGRISFDKYIQPICKNCLSKDEALLDTYMSCADQGVFSPEVKSLNNGVPRVVAKKPFSKKPFSNAEEFSIFKCGNLSKSTLCVRGTNCDEMPGMPIAIKDASKPESVVVGMTSKMIRCSEERTGIYAFTAAHEMHHKNLF